jgi:RNA polymerase sigma-70 factor, ECF subfamily
MECRGVGEIGFSDRRPLHELTVPYGMNPASSIDPTDGRRFAGHPESEPTELERRAIDAAKGGDWDALHYLYVRYADDVRAYVASITRDMHDAEDVTQSLFARLLTALERYEPREVAFGAWLMRVARNAALDHLRAKRQIPSEEVRVDDREQAQPNAERRRTLRDAFERLPGDQRRVLVMRHVLGLSPGEIAERLDKSESAVHGLHHRGRQALKRILVEFEAVPVTSRRRAGGEG